MGKASTRREIMTAQELARSGVLFAPASFLNATPDELFDVCNSCGAKDSWFRPPASLFGVKLGYACNIHDWMYEFGFTDEDKKEADRVFKINGQRMITRQGKAWYKPTLLLRIVGIGYYKATDWFGGEAYWKGKN